MITVSIFINGEPIYTRTAVNSGKEHDVTGLTLYNCDDNSEIWHDPNDGVVVLAKKMLDSIREVK